MGHTWSIFGAYLGHIWGIFGAYLGHIWGIHGTYVGHAWGIHGAYVGYLWGIHFQGTFLPVTQMKTFFSLRMVYSYNNLSCWQQVTWTFHPVCKAGLWIAFHH